MAKLPIIRTMMSVPGIRERFIEKARDIPADVILFDLEDSVAFADKPRAREIVKGVLPEFPKKGRMIFVRPNDLSTGLLEEDLDAIVQPGLDGIHLPKTHNPEVLMQADHYLTLLEKVRGIEPGTVKIIPWIESTEGLAKVEAICFASSRLIGASMGAEDYVTSLGVMRTRSGLEIEYGRARMANAAMAAGLVPIDCPEPDYQDIEHFEKDITHARGLGYRGKYCIHPTQVEVANRIFSPPPDQLDWARRVVDAYEEGERQGLGAVGLDGQMIDRPIYLRAVDLIEWQKDIDERTAALAAS